MCSVVFCLKNKDNAKYALHLSKVVFTALLACVFLASCGTTEKNMFCPVSFDAAETHWRSILPLEFTKTANKNQWQYSENVVFQITILKIPEGKDHIEWRKYLQKYFLDKNKSFSVISENMVSFKNWHGTKIQIKDRVDFCTYWFLSDEHFFMFVSLIDRKFEGLYPTLSELDDFFLYLEKEDTSPLVHAKTTLFDAGVEEFKKKNYKAAFDSFSEASKNGDESARIYLGYMYLEGLYVKPDPNKTYMLFREVAEKNNHLAQFALSQLLFSDEKSKPEKVAEGNQWLLKAAEGGNSEAQLNLAQRMLLGKDINQNTAVAVSWLNEAAKNGHPQANVILSALYLEGKFVQRDRKQGLILLKEEARKKNAHALGLLGLYGVSGRHIRKNVNDGFRLIDYAANHNSVDALYWRGLLLYAGMGCEQNKKKAFEDMNAAAKAEYENARLFLKHSGQYDKLDRNACNAQIEALIDNFWGQYLGAAEQKK